MRRTGIVGLSARALQRALCATTERLAVEVASPAAQAPEWSDVEWLMARAVAGIHGIAPLLAATLRWQGPDAWSEFLRQERALAQRRCVRIHELLSAIDGELRSAGVAAVALKGAALYGAGLYAPGERPMADVDLLVRPGDLELAARTFQALGFEESSRFWKNIVFGAHDRQSPWYGREPGEHPIKIELHERIVERLPTRAVDISASMFPRHAGPGLNPYPSTASLIAHLLLHTAGSMVGRLVRHVQLHDLALLAERASDADWAAALEIGANDRPPWWVLPPLALTARYYSRRVPPAVLATARAACPAALRRLAAHRRLADVSLSYPWTPGLPGIAWVRSPADLLEYVTQRMRGDDQRSVRRRAADTEPGLSPAEQRWLRDSQLTRALRWLVSRPARPLTMRIVRSTFGEREPLS